MLHHGNHTPTTTGIQPFSITNRLHVLRIEISRHEAILLALFS